MLYFNAVFALLLQLSTADPMFSETFWIKIDDEKNITNLILWWEFTAVSRVGCLLGCHNLYPHGCAYRHEDRRCQVYLDWGQISPWTMVEGMEFYLPNTVQTPSNDWIDMRKYGLPAAMVVGNQIMPWLNASSYCEECGGHLYVMDTEVKRKALIDLFEDKGISLTENYWLGLSDREVEGQWLWIDGGVVKSELWNPKEPNDKGQSDCGVLMRYKHFTLDDIECFKSIKFLCEIPLGP